MLKWNNANKKRYIDKGYEFTGIGKEFLVEIDDMTKTTRASIFVMCDYCGEEYEDTMKNRSDKIDRSIVKKDACSNCIWDKIRESTMLKYGKESTNQVEEIKKKKEKTYLDRYGAKSPLESEDVKNKIRNTMLKKYGVDNIFKSPEFIETISGENHYEWKGGVKPLKHFLRNKLSTWRLNSLKEHNYACFITGRSDSNLDIHHAYSFNKIFYETMNRAGIDIRDSIGKYTQDELNLIENVFRKTHDKYGLGYPMLEELHREFHNIYGREDNTLEQLLEFKEYILNNRDKNLITQDVLNQ